MSDDGLGISQIANQEKEPGASQLWNCPMCFKQVPYGKNGCEDPVNCPEEKNINFFMRYKRQIGSEDGTK